MIQRSFVERNPGLVLHPTVWILLLSLFSACAKGQPPEKVAQLMVDAASNKSGAAFDNLNETPPEQLAAAVTEWSSALESVLGERSHALVTLQIVTKTGELYRDGVFQPEESSKYAARVRAISRDRLASWQTAVSQFESGIEETNVLWFMARQPAMFEGSNLRGEIADRQLKRLGALPVDAVARWATLTEVDKDAAALALIQVDPLFQDSVFQPGVFDVAVPHAERLLGNGVDKE